MSAKKKNKTGEIESETALDESPKPNLIFTGLRFDREPLEEFSDGKNHKIAPASSQVATRTIKTPDGEREEKVALAFVSQTDPALVIRSLGSRLYKTPTIREVNEALGIDEGDEGDQGE